MCHCPCHSGDSRTLLPAAPANCLRCFFVLLERCSEMSGYILLFYGDFDDVFFMATCGKVTLRPFSPFLLISPPALIVAPPPSLPPPPSPLPPSNDQPLRIWVFEDATGFCPCDSLETRRGSTLEVLPEVPWLKWCATPDTIGAGTSPIPKWPDGFRQRFQSTESCESIRSRPRCHCCAASACHCPSPAFSACVAVFQTSLAITEQHAACSRVGVLRKR